MTRTNFIVSAESLEAFGKIANQLLQDVQERLVFRAHLYLQSDILNYKPSSGDLAYPEKLEMMEVRLNSPINFFRHTSMIPIFRALLSHCKNQFWNEPIHVLPWYRLDRKWTVLQVLLSSNYVLELEVCISNVFSKWRVEKLKEFFSCIRFASWFARYVVSNCTSYVSVFIATVPMYWSSNIPRIIARGINVLYSKCVKCCATNIRKKS